MIFGRPKHETDERIRLIRLAFKTDADLRERLWNRQSGTCVICRVGLPYSNDPFLVVDHTHPIVQYAVSPLSIERAIELANDEDNLAIVHSDCNSAKNAWDLEELHEAIKRGEVTLSEPNIYTTEQIEAEKIRRASISSIGGRKHVESGHITRMNELPQTKEAKRAVGRIAHKSGHLARIRELPQSKEAQRKSGRIQGHISVESGHLARIRELPQSKEAQRKGGLIQGHISVESGRITALGRRQGRKNAENGHCARIAGTAAHTRWHHNRGIIKQGCNFCEVTRPTAA